MVYRRRFLSNPSIYFPPAVVPAEEPVTVAVAAEEPVTVAVAAEEPVTVAAEEPEVVVVEPVVATPKAPKRASKAKKTPVAE